MTPEERRLQRAYEQMFEERPLFRKACLARVGRGDPLTPAEEQAIEDALEGDPGFILPVLEAALGLKGRPASPDLLRWMREHGVGGPVNLAPVAVEGRPNEQPSGGNIAPREEDLFDLLDSRQGGSPAPRGTNTPQGTSQVPPDSDA